MSKIVLLFSLGTLLSCGQLEISHPHINAHHLFPIIDGDKWGAINIQGRQIIPSEYDWIYYNSFGNGILIAEKDTNKLIINLKNELLYESRDYDERLSIIDSGFVVLNKTIRDTVFYSLDRCKSSKDTVDGVSILSPKWLSKNECIYVAKSGEQRIDVVFNRCSKFSINGIALVLGNNNWGYIDLNGDYIWKEDLPELNEYFLFKEQERWENYSDYIINFERNKKTEELVDKFNLLVLDFEKKLNQDMGFIRFRKYLEI